MTKWHVAAIAVFLVAAVVMAGGEAQDFVDALQAALDVLLGVAEEPLP